MRIYIDRAMGVRGSGGSAQDFAPEMSTGGSVSAAIGVAAEAAHVCDRIILFGIDVIGPGLTILPCPTDPEIQRRRDRRSCFSRCLWARCWQFRSVYSEDCITRSEALPGRARSPR